jgi:hypothetical protein
MVMANDRCDLGVVLYIRKDSLADLGVLLHLATLVQSERTWLLEQARGETDLSNIVDETAEVRKPLVFFREFHPLSDVSGINGDSGGMACRVLVSSIERGNERGGERKVRALQTVIDLIERFPSISLLTVEAVEAMSGECRGNKENNTPLRDLAAGVEQ